MSQYQETRLKNGLRIISEKQSNTKAVSMCIALDIGSQNELKHLNGISHLIEHLVFRGTKKRSALQISEKIEMLGGDLNAYTGREITCFHTYMLAKDYKVGVEILSELILEPRLDEVDIKKEKQVVTHEIAMTEDYFEEQIFDDFYEKWYPKQSIGRPILGTKKSLKNINKKAIKNYMQQMYNCENMVFVASGNLNHELFVKEVKKYFAKEKKISIKNINYEKAKESRFFEIKKTNTEQSHMLFGFPASSYDDGIYYEASIINTYLGAGSSSLLNQDLREKRPLCYSAYSSFAPLKHNGAFLIYVGSDKKHMLEITKIICRRLKEIREKGISKINIENIKQQWLKSLILQSEDIETRMNIILQDSFLNRKYRSIKEMEKVIKKVSQTSVKDYIDKYFTIEQMSLLIFSDENKSKLKKLKAIIQ